MKKLAIIYDCLEIGGISTYLINLLKNIDLTQTDVTLIVKSIDDYILSQISKEIKVVKIKDISLIKKIICCFFQGRLIDMLKLFFKGKGNLKKGKSVQNLQLINAKASNTINEEFDYAIGADLYWPNYYTIYNINAKKRYLWIHPEYSSLGNDVKIDEKVFSKADKIFAVSKKNAEILEETFPCLKEKIDYISNFINEEDITERANSYIDNYDKSELNIVTVCRLDNSSKRLDRIVEVAKKLKEKGVKFVWRIVGEGQDRAFIEKLIENSDLDEQVLLLGAKTNPYPYVKNSDLFVLLSQYEGVPLAVTEAMVLGVPVLVSKYESAEQQVSCDNGFIVDNDDLTIIENACNIIEKYNPSESKEKQSYQVDNSDSLSKIIKILSD